MWRSTGHAISMLDDRALLWINQYLGRWPLLDAFLAWMLNAHLFKFGPIVVAICALWFARSAQQERTRRLLIDGVLSGAVALFVGRALALLLPFRERPVNRADLEFVQGVEVGARTWSSFPSDHAMLAFALAVSLFRLSPALGIWAMLHAIVLICLPRLYFGYHYPSDLIGGALIGAAIALAWAGWPGRRAATEPIMRAERQHPALFHAVAFVVLFEFTEMFDSLRVAARVVFRGLRQLVE